MTTPLTATTAPTDISKRQIQKLGYSHEAMIDAIIADPSVPQYRLAEIFDRTPNWISIVINSDAFQARLGERRRELIDPVLLASIDDRLNVIAKASLDHIMTRLTRPEAGTLASEDFLMRSADMALKALNYGARPSEKPQMIVNIGQAESQL